jgi:type I restriction enzyme S subunit
MAGESCLRLSDVAELKGGYAFKSKDYTEDGRFILRTVNIRDDGRITREGSTFIPEELAVEYKRFSLCNEDTLFVMVGATLGKVGFVTNSDLPALLNQNMWVIRSKDKNTTDPRYLNFWFQAVVGETLAWASGSARGFVRRDDYRNLEFPQISFPEQKAIAHVLGSLDDKIELNRRMNETLEEMAQALFKSWFVDFDPVIDNALAAGNPIPEPLAQRAETRRQALANGTANRETAQAFPASFRFTEELGWIPEGWKIEQLGDIASILNGFAFQSADYTDSGIFVLRTKNFDANGLSSRRSDDVFLPESFAESHSSYLSQPFDFHLVMVGASIGKTSLLLPHLLPALRNQNMWCFRPNSMFQSRSYLNLTIQKKVSEVMTWASGSARSFFRKSDFKTHKILVPSENLLTDFEDQVGPMFLGISNTSSESETLAKLRDVLLPKLISGELRIPQAEKMVEKAVA